ncbi:MAG: hypothetical protein LZF64_01630 [Nitrosomonas sp.]|nr:MAG: hypothetical protein LZF64_01630 [Nitrosomonas sp.]
MSYFKKLAVSCVFLLGTPLAQADYEFNTKFSEPGKMCFPQTSLRAEPNKFSNIMLDHYLIVSKEDHFKGGLVYVGFRLKSQPDELWLFDGANWVKRSDSDSPSPFIPREYASLPTGQLQPIMHTFVSNYPIDASAFVGDGELWVGYGVSSVPLPKGAISPCDSECPGGNTSQEIFDEMMSSGRFRLIWEIGNPQVATVGDLGLPSTICLSIPEMTEIEHILTTQ